MIVFVFCGEDLSINRRQWEWWVVQVELVVDVAHCGNLGRRATGLCEVQRYVEILSFPFPVTVKSARVGLPNWGVLVGAGRASQGRTGSASRRWGELGEIVRAAVCARPSPLLRSPTNFCHCWRADSQPCCVHATATFVFSPHFQHLQHVDLAHREAHRPIGAAVHHWGLHSLGHPDRRYRCLQAAMASSCDRSLRRSGWLSGLQQP